MRASRADAARSPRCVRRPSVRACRHRRRRPKGRGAGRFAGAREDDVMVGDAAVGNPGLFAVDADMRIAIRLRGRRQRRDVRAGLRLRQREGGDRTAFADRRQIARLESPASRTARSSRCRVPAWRRRNRRGRRERREFRARGRACARRAARCMPPKARGTTARRKPASPSALTRARQAASTSSCGRVCSVRSAQAASLSAKPRWRSSKNGQVSVSACGSGAVGVIVSLRRRWRCGRTTWRARAASSGRRRRWCRGRRKPPRSSSHARAPWRGRRGVPRR